MLSNSRESSRSRYFCFISKIKRGYSFFTKKKKGLRAPMYSPQINHWFHHCILTPSELQIIRHLVRDRDRDVRRPTYFWSTGLEERRARIPPRRTTSSFPRPTAVYQCGRVAACGRSRPRSLVRACVRILRSALTTTEHRQFSGHVTAAALVGGSCVQRCPQTLSKRL